MGFMRRGSGGAAPDGAGSPCGGRAPDGRSTGGDRSPAPAEPMYYDLFASLFGRFGLVWRAPSGEALIMRVLLPQGPVGIERRIASLHPGALPGSCRDVSDLGERIAAFLSGRPVAFDLTGVELSRCPPFQRAVLEAEARIPRGCTSSYGLIARHIGHPGAARAVGAALARNPFPVIVPCHRAIRADGRLGGFQGGISMKRALLEYEGIRFDPAGRVRPDRVYYAQ
jgi:methylated-DNA-[protein]-cysteine S-methyltransferase